MIKFILRILRYNLPRLHNTLCTVSLATFDVLYTVQVYIAIQNFVVVLAAQWSFLFR